MTNVGVSGRVTLLGDAASRLSLLGGGTSAVMSCKLPSAFTILTVISDRLCWSHKNAPECTAMLFRASHFSDMYGPARRR